MTVLRGLRKNNTNSSICSPGDKSTTSSADDTRACTGIAAQEIRRKRVSCAAAAGEGDTRVAPRTSARAQAIRRKRVSASASSPQQRVAESAAANSAAVDATSASGQTPQDLEAQNLVDNNSKDEEEAAGDERPGMVREAEMRDNEAPVDEEIAEMNEPAPSNLPEETEAFKEMELVEARPVAVDDITHAETTLTPVDPGILERETIKKQKEIECQRIGAMLICMLVLVMMLSIIFARGSSGEQDLLAMPMVAPALVPTSTPTTAPTSSLLSVFVTNHMPRCTQLALSDPHSPQSLVHTWLLTHPSFAEHPVWRQQQLHVLAIFFCSFEGPHWPPQIQSDWMRCDKSKCEWFSSHCGAFDADGSFDPCLAWADLPNCNNEQQHNAAGLTGLHLGNHAPALPREIELLTSLQALVFPINELRRSLRGVPAIESLVAGPQRQFHDWFDPNRTRFAIQQHGIPCPSCEFFDRFCSNRDWSARSSHGCHCWRKSHFRSLSGYGTAFVVHVDNLGCSEQFAHRFRVARGGIGCESDPAVRSRALSDRGDPVVTWRHDLHGNIGCEQQCPVWHNPLKDLLAVGSAASVGLWEHLDRVLVVQR